MAKSPLYARESWLLISSTMWFVFELHLALLSIIQISVNEMKYKKA